MDISNFVTDAEAETQGRWVDCGDGLHLQVARTGNPEYRKVLNRLMRPHRRRVGSLPEDLAEQIQVELMAETVLLGWKGLEENGQAVEFNRTNVLRMLAIRDFRDLVWEIASEKETFRAVQLEEALGN